MRKYVVFTAILLLYPAHATASSQVISPIHVVIDAGHGGLTGEPRTKACTKNTSIWISREECIMNCRPKGIR